MDATLHSSQLLGGELGETRDAVREATRGVVEKFDRGYWLSCARDGSFTDEMWQMLADQGILGLGVPEAWGGSGGGMTELSAAVEMLSEAGVPLALLVLTAFGRETILRHGDDEQRQRLVKPTATGASRMCFAITEPNAGTNAFAMETLATRTADGYRLKGQKLFISGADSSDKMMVVARTTRLADVDDRRQGLSLLVVDTDSPGLELQPQDIGILMPDRQSTVYFDDVEVPAENLIGEPDQGFRYLFDALNPERLLVAAWAVGLGDHVLAKAVSYATDRAPFGRPIGSYQAVQHPLAQTKARLDAARLMMYRAAALFDEGSNAGYLANAAKLLASQAGVDACDAAIQTHGGYGFTDEYDVLTVWPMSRLLKVAPVNNEMVLNYIGEHILRLPRSY